MNCDEEQYMRICKERFDAIDAKLDGIDQALRGNGRPGIRHRLDILERAAGIWGKLVWLVIGAGMTIVGIATVQRIGG